MEEPTSLSKVSSKDGGTNSNFSLFNKVPAMPADDLILSEVAILSGGRDQEGRPLVVFPSKQFRLLETQVKATGLDQVIQYFMDISRSGTTGFGFVADLRKASEEVISILVSTLNSVQASSKGGVAMFYALRPSDSKHALKHLLTLLALRKTKKNIMPPLFTSFLVSDELELTNHVDRSHLPTSLGGYLGYAHTAWVRFRKTVDPVYMRYEAVLARAPSMLEKLRALEPADLTSDPEQLDLLRRQLEKRHQAIIRDSGLEEMYQESCRLAATFDRPQSDPVYQAVSQKAVFLQAQATVQQYHLSLATVKGQAESMWSEVEGRIAHNVGYLQYRARLTRVCEWLQTTGMMYLRAKPETARHLERAQLLKDHFDTCFGATAKAKLEEAAAVVQLGEEMVIAKHPDMAPILKDKARLQLLQQRFTGRLDQRRQLLHSVYHFYRLVDQLANWYRRVLQLLPFDLLTYDSAGDWRWWRGQAEAFLEGHPPPSDRQLETVKQSMPLVSDTRLRTHTRLLLNRCGALRRLLAGVKGGGGQGRGVAEALHWKSQYMEGKDHILLANSPLLEVVGSKGRGEADSGHHSLSERGGEGGRPRRGDRPGQHHHRKQGKPPDYWNGWGDDDDDDSGGWGGRGNHARPGRSKSADRLPHRSSQGSAEGQKSTSGKLPGGWARGEPPEKFVDLTCPLYQLAAGGPTSGHHFSGLFLQPPVKLTAAKSLHSLASHPVSDSGHGTVRSLSDMSQDRGQGLDTSTVVEKEVSSMDDVVHALRRDLSSRDLTSDLPPPSLKVDAASLGDGATPPASNHVNGLTSDSRGNLALGSSTGSSSIFTADIEEFLI